jgi:hypothetical protein
MKKITTWAFVIALLAMQAACTKENLKGEGENKVETRTVQAFSQVHLSGLREAEIIPSNDYKVEISGYENLLERFETKSENGHLHFRFTENPRVKNDNIKLKIFTPSVQSIYQSGNTKVKVAQGFTLDVLQLLLSGNSAVEIAGGTAQTFRVEASGNANVKARPLQSKSANIRVSGNVRAEVSPVEYLLVEGSGNARVYYWGTPPTMDVRTTGTARVLRQ